MEQSADAHELPTSTSTSTSSIDDLTQLDAHKALNKLALKEARVPESESGMQRREGLYGFEFRKKDNRRADCLADRKLFDITQLWQSNHEIINLTARGFKQVEVAEILNVNISTVKRTLNSELGMLKLSEIRLERDNEAKKVSEKIRVLTKKALTVYHEIFDDESGECGLKDKGEFAKHFLNDMSGLRAATKVQSVSAHYTLSKEELDGFKTRGIEAANETGLVIEARQSEASASQPAGEVEHLPVI